jgi:hypothetical protein
MLLSKSRSGLRAGPAAVPFAAQQAMQMSSGAVCGTGLSSRQTGLQPGQFSWRAQANVHAQKRLTCLPHRRLPTGPQVQTGTVVNSLLVGIYRFWRSQNPMDKPHAPVDDRMLPAIVDASDKRAAVGM